MSTYENGSLRNVKAVDLLAIASRDMGLKKVGAYEYHGPLCPKCGGREGGDRLSIHTGGHKAGGDGRHRWICRQCKENGDAIDYVRARDGLDYAGALASLGLAGGAPPASESTKTKKREIASPGPGNSLTEPVNPPPEAWQEKGWILVALAAALLWDKQGEDMLAQLRARGLSDETIKSAWLGYLPPNSKRSIKRGRPGWYYRPLVKWGLEPAGRTNHLGIPPGLVIPHFEHATDTLHRIRIRSLEGYSAPKYYQIKGGSAWLYGEHTLKPEAPAVLLEGEIDALTLAQEIPELGAVATGSTTHCRRGRWIAALSRPPAVLVAYDGDEAGDKASSWWIDILSPRAQRLRPWWGDANDMHTTGADLRAWLAPAYETMQ